MDAFGWGFGGESYTEKGFIFYWSFIGFYFVLIRIYSVIESIRCLHMAIPLK